MRKRVTFEIEVPDEDSMDSFDFEYWTDDPSREEGMTLITQPIPGTLTVTDAAQGEAHSKPNKTEQRLYDITFLYHKQRGHNQYFERCEHEECIQTRDVLNFRTNWHWYDKAYLEAAPGAAEDGKYETKS